MTVTILENCRLLDCIDFVLKDGHSIVVEDDRIREVSDQPVRINADRRLDLRGRTVMPGLIDAHVHVFAIHLNQELTRDMPHTLMMAHAAHRARAMLDRGFTTVRDVAGGDWGIKQAIAEGIMVGPRLFVAGRALSQTGGHGDHRFRTTDELPCTCNSALDVMTRIADGIDGVQRAAREELRKGADHIKVMVSGGVGSPNDHIDNTQYTIDEVHAAVREAEARGTYVAAHSYTAKSTRNAVEAGVRTIEHGNLVDPEVAALMAEKGTFMVPTLVCYGESARHADDFDLSPVVRAKLDYVNTAGIRMLEICHSAGVKMGFGTDLMGEMHVYQSREFAIRGDVLPAAAVIASATVVNAEILQQSGQLGVIAPGAYADMIALDGDPLSDLSLFLNPSDTMPLIMQAGRLHKNLIN